MDDISRLTSLDKPSYIGVPLYTFSKATAFAPLGGRPGVPHHPHHPNGMMNNMGGGARPTVKLLFSSSDDGTVKVWDLIVSWLSLAFPLRGK